MLLKIVFDIGIIRVSVIWLLFIESNAKIFCHEESFFENPLS